ncbi:MAG: SAM-dependent chlorinase/fluorinase [Candidatus Lokiarchaeota archaeon]|nr:SAM-dependent chlorinase/fluorinase [Candidatus Lokiarchaeota archaeon]
MNIKKPNPDRGVIALLTDFGTKGHHYVASMKGIILKINPNVNIIDVSHEIAPFSILEAGYITKNACKHFPEDTVFIIVVDPGVGGNREVICAKTKSQQYFIAPNNGILSIAFDSKEIVECVELNDNAYFNNPVSSTFHGRDIMAPVGAHLLKGTPLGKFGSSFRISTLEKYPIEYQFDMDNKKIRCIVFYIDSFGNVTTNVSLEGNRVKDSTLVLSQGNLIKIRYNGNDFSGEFRSHFASMPKGTLFFLQGSSGFLEISINQGSAASTIGCNVGDIITVFFD